MKTTYFVENLEETDKVDAIISKISSLTKREPRDIRLLLKPGSEYLNLEASAVLEQIGITNDTCIYLVFWIGNENNPAEGQWEEVQVPNYEAEPVENKS